MHLGTVISTFDAPTTQKFCFVIRAGGVKRGQFVQAYSDEGIVIAVVSTIQRANRYFERAESVSEYERNPASATFLESFPAGEWEYVVASCSVLGAWEGSLRRVGYPLSPGTKITAIEEGILKQFLGFQEGGMHFGKLLQHDVPVKLGANRLLQKHLSILGISGSGKSVCASVLIEEMLARKAEQGRLSIVVFDVHGEYAGFADKRRNPQFADKAILVPGESIRIATHKLSNDKLKNYLPEVSGTQARELDKIMRGMKQQMREGGAAFSLQEVIAQVDSSGMKDNVKAPLLGWLYELRGLRNGKSCIFGRGDYPRLKEVVAPGKLTVFDLSCITNNKVKQVIVDYFSRKLFNAREKNKAPPFVLLVEEAHNFAREKAPKGASISKSIIEKIAREGRKFGACLCLVSQRPKQLSSTALSQCNSNIIFRITNPYDLDHIAESCEAIDAPTKDALTSLQVGECIVLGEAVNAPIFVRCRNRTSQRTAGKGDDLELLAKNYEKQLGKELTVEDAEAFV